MSQNEAQEVEQYNRSLASRRSNQRIKWQQWDAVAVNMTKGHFSTSKLNP
jgi:hypothetical protein